MQGPSPPLVVPGIRRGGQSGCSGPRRTQARRHTAQWPGHGPGTVGTASGDQAGSERAVRAGDAAQIAGRGLGHLARQVDLTGRLPGPGLSQVANGPAVTAPAARCLSRRCVRRPRTRLAHRGPGLGCRLPRSGRRIEAERVHAAIVKMRGDSTGPAADVCDGPPPAEVPRVRLCGEHRHDGAHRLAAENPGVEAQGVHHAEHIVDQLAAGGPTTG